MGKIVLYIEDNPDNVLLVQRALESRGYKFVWAPNGSTGLSKVESEKPDLILLDINLPDIDGYEIARRLRASEAMRKIPIVAITANALKGDADKALAAGCDVYISKPINLRELWMQLAALVPSN
ncbi:MAG TPA: response regulator [Anaerolineales bacterium]|nr:response regulator [Anaerolineales bacterium]